MSLDSIHWRGKEAELSHRLYIKKPEAIDSIKDVEYYDSKASEAISEAEEYINTLKEYRQALYERYQEVCSTNFHLFLHLERFVSYYDKTKTYIITIAKRFDGNNVADEVILKEKFDGRERHKALKRFESLKKEYPNIEHDTDIEKKSWER